MSGRKRSPEARDEDTDRASTGCTAARPEPSRDAKRRARRTPAPLRFAPAMPSPFADRLEVGDCRLLLPRLPDESIHCCVTSPPYWGLRDYGVTGQLGLERTPDEYVAHLVQIFREVRRVLKPEGTLWLNLGDCYATGAGHARSAGGRRGRDWPGPIEQPNRLPVPGLKPKDLVGIPWRVAFALQADGWYLRTDIVWAKPNAYPESVADRPTRAHEYIFLFAKSRRYHYDAAAVREKATTPRPPGRGFQRPERLTYQNGKGHACGSPRPWTVKPYRNRRTVWNIRTRPYRGAHFATFPAELVEPCVLAGCPPEGLVLDPFAGSGTVGEVARKLGRHFVLFDLNADYVELAKERLAVLDEPIGSMDIAK